MTATLVESLFFSVSWVKSRITGTRLAAAPAERMTFSISSAVKSSRGMSVMLAFSTALRSFRSVSLTDVYKRQVHGLAQMGGAG